MSRLQPLTEEQANAIYDVLTTEIGAKPCGREEFIKIQTEGFVTGCDVSSRWVHFLPSLRLVRLDYIDDKTGEHVQKMYVECHYNAAGKHVDLQKRLSDPLNCVVHPQLGIGTANQVFEMFMEYMARGDFKKLLEK
jgi:hypothetical protein